MYQYFFTPSYNDCLRQYESDPEFTKALVKVLPRFASDPLHDPALNTHRVKRAAGKTYTSYVGGRGHRIIWRLVNRTVVFLLVGEHDGVYERAERIRVEIDLNKDLARVYDEDPESQEPIPYESRRQREGVLFMAWTDQDLAGFGFENHELTVLRSLQSQGELLELEEHMRPAAWQAAFNLVAYGHPEGETSQPVPERVEPVAASEEEPDERALERAISAKRSRSEFAPVTAEALESVLSRPIEDWMVFLHPDQAKLAERPFSGPARVRGSAGTGKTVVGLHRAKHLASTYGGQVLFTTYVRNLPTVFEQLFRRLAPDANGSVEFRNLHSWAYRFLANSGSRPELDANKVNAAFAAAWRQCAEPGSYLAERGLGRQYYREEIDWVIKGRDLRRLDEYLEVERTGRGTGLPESQRRAVWELFEQYQRQLRQRRTVDFNDLLIDALRMVREDGVRKPYDAVIVDEAQDLTQVGVQLAYELAGGDKPDGLFLLGDGQQSVYPGGYSLSSIGIGVQGRSSLLKVNYRSTQALLDFARRIIEGRPYDDGDEGLTSAQRDVTCLRKGSAPELHGAATIDDHDESLVLAIADAAESPMVAPGDVAVLVPTNKLVAVYSQRISDLGYPTQKLEKYDGTPTNSVKVGTYQRAKGLEFKHVFLPRLDAEAVGEERRAGEDDAAHQERLDLLRRQLFVALTRARDAAWVGWVGEPAQVLEVALN